MIARRRQGSALSPLDLLLAEPDVLALLRRGTSPAAIDTFIADVAAHDPGVAARCRALVADWRAGRYMPRHSHNPKEKS